MRSADGDRSGRAGRATRKCRCRCTARSPASVGGALGVTALKRQLEDGAGGDAQVLSVVGCGSRGTGKEQTCERRKERRRGGWGKQGCAWGDKERD